MAKKKYYPKNKIKGNEENEHLTICNYIRLKYPDVIFLTDASGVRMPMHTAKKFSTLKSGRGIPDLIILEPRGGYAGLMLEIKRTNEKIYLKGTNKLLSNKHLHEQGAVLDRLMHKGYASYFCIGSRMGIDLVDEYMMGAVEPKEEN